ncbi:MAG: ABC transporter permease [Spirochaetia bacterium]
MKREEAAQRLGFLRSRTTTSIVAFIAVFLVVGSLAPKQFLRGTNIQQMAFQLPEFGVLALAMMLAMLTGGIDLSITTSSVLSGIVAAITLLSVASRGRLDISIILKGIMAGENPVAAMVQQMPFDGRMLLIILLTVVVALGVGAACGLLNGFLVAVVRIPPILATLGTMKLFEGISYVLTVGSPIKNFPKPFLFLGSGLLLHIPMPMVIFIVCALLVTVLLNRTSLGFSIYAVGMNPIAAKFSGIRNRGVLVRTYLTSGLLAGVAALLIMSRVDSIKVGYGSSYQLQTILVCILGGVSTIGGSGNIADVFLSILMLRIISSGFNIAGLSEYFRNVIWGLLLVLVTGSNVLLPQIVSRIRARAHR